MGVLPSQLGAENVQLVSQGSHRGFYGLSAIRYLDWREEGISPGILWVQPESKNLTVFLHCNIIPVIYSCVTVDPGPCVPIYPVVPINPGVPVNPSVPINAVISIDPCVPIYSSVSTKEPWITIYSTIVEVLVHPPVVVVVGLLLGCALPGVHSSPRQVLQGTNLNTRSTFSLFLILKDYNQFDSFLPETVNNRDFVLLEIFFF